MHRYKWFSNINWGPCFDPKTQAHYASASDIETLQKSHGPIDQQSLLVHQGHGYRWVTEVPVHLGGLSREWHGERA